MHPPKCRPATRSGERAAAIGIQVFAGTSFDWRDLRLKLTTVLAEHFEVLVVTALVAKLQRGTHCRHDDSVL